MALMWNSPTHALSDIEVLAYERTVPVSERIEPCDLNYPSEEYSVSSQVSPIFESTPMEPDTFPPRMRTGRGRGALLANRDMIHRDDFELAKQLRLATGLGNSNSLIESFVHSQPEKTASSVYSQPEEAASSVYSQPEETAPYVADGANACGLFHDDDDPTMKEFIVDENLSQDLSDEEDTSVNENGEWIWVKRTSNPLVGAIPKNNVALASIARQLKKAKEKKRLHNEKCEITDKDPLKVKEDWRAEIRAAEEAGEVASKLGWRSRMKEPLLAGLQIDNHNWSMFTPTATPPLADESTQQVPTGEGIAQNSVKDRLQCLEEIEPPHRGRKKKKKHLNIKPMFVPLSNSNGVQRCASDNHNTYGNVFQRALQPLREHCGTFDRSLNLTQNDFPQLQ